MIRSHWGVIENGLHWVRDVVFREDRSTITSGHAQQNFAALRNAVIAGLRADKTDNLAATLRSHYRKPQRLFTKLGLLEKAMTLQERDRAFPTISLTFRQACWPHSF